MTNRQNKGLDRFLHEWLHLIISDSPLPGMSVAISRFGRPIFQRAYGVSDVDTCEPLQSTTQMEVASQSKMLTSLATLLLADKGKIELHAPVANYVPQIVDDIPWIDSISVYDLLTHQAKLPRDFVLPFGDDLADAIRRTVAWAGPNDPMRYSNVGYAILGELVSRTSNQPFRQFVTSSIIDACGMTLTSFDANPLAEQSTPHGPLRRGRVEPVGPYADSFDGVSGIWSTPTDMCRLVQAFSSSGVISQDLRTLAMATQWGPSRASFGACYGVGLEIRTLGGHRWLGHTGGAPGFVSATFFCPDTDWAFSIAFNSRALRELEGVMQTIAMAIEEWDSSPNGSATERFEPFTGLYDSDLGYLQIVRTPRRCIDINPSEWSPLRTAYELQYESATSLRISGGDFNNANVKLEFGATPEGRLQSVNAAGLTYTRRDNPFC